MGARRLLALSMALQVAACAAPRGSATSPAAAGEPGAAGSSASGASRVGAAPRSLSPADIAARAFPAVVTIRTGDSLGTGFVVRPDGWIATNLHVIVGGARIKVTFRDARELEVTEVL